MSVSQVMQVLTLLYSTLLYSTLLCSTLLSVLPFPSLPFLSFPFPSLPPLHVYAEQHPTCKVAAPVCVSPGYRYILVYTTGMPTGVVHVGNTQQERGGGEGREGGREEEQ